MNISDNMGNAEKKIEKKSSWGEYKRLKEQAVQIALNTPPESREFKQAFDDWYVFAQKRADKWTGSIGRLWLAFEAAKLFEECDYLDEAIERYWDVYQQAKNEGREKLSEKIELRSIAIGGKFEGPRADEDEVVES